jgi:hypothetical protein
MPPSWRDRALLAALGAVPAPLAKHALSLLRSHPSLADSLGYHVRPIHYYEPLPDFRHIAAEATARPRVSAAIDFDLAGQQRLARRLADTWRSELAPPLDPHFDFANDYFSGLDAAIYYALIRDLRPACVIEIGAGMSTRIAALALARNRQEGHAGRLECIEPFPGPRLTDRMPETTLIQKRVEDVPLEHFDSLGANDILFIDSSHAVKFGGDVCREFLDILPRLKPGVWIHVHDVFFPHDYPAAWLIERRWAFTEQYLLEAFLAFNQSFSVRLCLHWLWADDRESCRDWPDAVHAGAERHPPSSFWMTRVA